VSFGYTITDGQGRIVESLGGDTRLSPVMNGWPSPLQYDVASSIPPGDYTLKLAMAEGERVGTVEHKVQAWLTEAPPVRLSELMVGGPVEVRELQRPTIGHVAAFGSVHGYFEAYGAEAAALKASYEIAANATSPALVTETVDGQRAGSNRVIFSKVMLIRQIPPGKYVLRAVLSGQTGLLKTLSRDFEVAAPPVLMTSTEVSGAVTTVSEVYLPVGSQLLARAFRPDDALNAETLQSFRARVAPPAQRAFDDGVSSIRAKEYAKAERTLKTAIRGDLDSTAAMVYLAAVYAAAGHDSEAASTWQTALVDGGDFPQIYEWLGDALMRTRHFAEARSILEEAAGKWPADLRFAKPLAYLYATFGQGREAMRTLARYLPEHPEDVDALGLGVQWTYELHQTGATAQTRAEDVKAARGWASLYEKAKGPQTALVRQWMQFLEKPR
jgi:Tfp pilus assembly protein PilF